VREGVDELYAGLISAPVLVPSRIGAQRPLRSYAPMFRLTSRAEMQALREEMRTLREEVINLNRVVLAQGTTLLERVLQPEQLDELSKQAWVHARPNSGLTWNVEMTGAEFVGHVRRQAGEDLGRLLEIGPGYGRLLTTILGDSVKFSDYSGVDISAENVKYLTGRFGNDRVRFRHADFFTYETPDRFDCIICSAVFMHFYPSVEPALRRCRALLRDGGRLCFDVPRGASGERYLDPASRLYVRGYGAKELAEFAKSAGFSRSTVVEEDGFAPGQRGWFVCATA
jgi:SAM-dependent methyltransferase